MHKNLQVLPGIRPFLANRSLGMSQREGDPIVQQPLVLELEDRQQQVFMYVFQTLAEAKTIGIQRLWDECLEVLGRLHFAITCFASVVARLD